MDANQLGYRDQIILTEWSLHTHIFNKSGRFVCLQSEQGAVDLKPSVSQSLGMEGHLSIVVEPSGGKSTPFFSLDL